MKTVLIAGASGVVGRSAVNSFLAAGWRVLAASRRPPLDEPADRLIHLPIDLRDAASCSAAIAAHPAPSHLVYAAVSELPGLAAGWRDRATMQTNLKMLENVLNPLSAAGALQHVSILQGSKAYGVHLHPAPVPSREDGPRDPHENFYWLQEDAVRAAAARRGFRFTILRPPVIGGGAAGVVMNVVLPIATFAAICRQQGLPFGFPGGPANPFDMVDARIVAAALLWAADAPAAAGQIFNVGNGDVAEWRALWPILAEALGVDPAPDRPVALARFLPEQRALWAEIAHRHRLREADLTALLGESHHYADMIFGHGQTASPPPVFLSTIKIRRAGFADCMDSAETFRFWIADLIRRRVIPPAER